MFKVHVALCVFLCSRASNTDTDYASEDVVQCGAPTAA
jgi:hypothetical protein